MRQREMWIACVLVISIPAMAAETSFRPDPQGFIRDWLIAGPYPNYQTNGGGQALDTDFLHGEAELVPYPGLKGSSEFVADAGKLVAGIGSTNEWGFTETKTFDATWQVKSFADSKIAFDKMFLPIDDYFAVYAVCWIESPSQRKIKLGVGSDDDHKIYLNGKLVGRHYGSQATTPDQFMYDAELQPGLNRLLFKLVDRTNDASFCLRLTDPARKPMNDLIIYTDSPARKYGAELYQNGYAGNLSFKTPHLFAGPQRLDITVFSDKKEPYTLLLNGKPVRSGTTPVTLSDGKNLLKLEVIVNGQTAAVLQKEVMAYSRETLAAENKNLKREVRKNAVLLSSLNNKRQILEKQLTGILADRKKIYQEIEQKYAAQREAACKEGKKSIDEPMTPATVRSRLCLNGEWEASTDRKNWSEFVLPAKMYNEFFRTWYNPVKNVDPKNPYGKVLPIKGWEEYRISPVVHASKAWFRRNFTTEGGAAVTFVCGAVRGKLQVFSNGMKCGDYPGWMGQVEIPLKNLKPGDNILELYFEVDRRAYNANAESGLVGDLYLDFTSPVKMADVWVKPSWRKASLSLTSEIENRTDKEQGAEIRQYVAQGGRIKLKLQNVKQTLPPHQTITFTNSEKWADPLLWGIGGEYGNPDLYDLVSDVYVDGKLVDRYVQPFGFREFWIHATDFYLNGKRIILQGDLGHYNIAIAKIRDVIWPLLRHDGINIIRYHVAGAECGDTAAAADRMGMLSYVQMYPVVLPIGQKPDQFSPFETWTKTSEHQYNLENYRRWFRLFRNHPSVVIWSTDNEIFTQAWDTAAKLEFNIRNDKVGALYEKYMKTLDPDLVLTRDGDIGTWSHRGRWFENPPCDTANYHYPEFNSAEQIINWQNIYDYRPVIFGETLYHSYGAWDKNIGAIPSQVQKKALTVRSVAGLYRMLEVPGQIYMGLSLDGFTVHDDSGKGNPWGLTAAMYDRYLKDGTIPEGFNADHYPWYRLPWPACSGTGMKDIAVNVAFARVFGNCAINWFDPRYPTHIRNAVNEAYKETLLPQPPLREPDEGECIIVGKPFADIWSVAADGIRYGVRADKNGKAWFQLPTAGQYTFEADGIKKVIDVPSRKSYAAKPGFDQIKFFELK